MKEYMVLGVAFGWGKRKGLDIFIKLARELGEQYQVVLVGTCDAVGVQFPDNILLVGQISNQVELAEIYSSADVFVNPTREDNYPTVNMEALACGTPVITFPTGGSPEMLDQSSGVVLSGEDISPLEECIREICENRRISRSDCLRQANKFDMRKRWAEYVDLYEENNIAH